MDYIIALGGLFLLHILALISPGPNVLIVTQTAMHSGRQKGVFVSLGLATGAAIWSSAALIGLNVIFEYVTWLYWALKIVGGVYLIFIGIKIWRTAKQDLSQPNAQHNINKNHWQSYRLGLFTSLTNPKAGIFFSSIFVAILPPTLPLWVQIFAIVLMTCDSAIFHISLAIFFSTNRVKQIYTQIKVYVDRLASIALTLLGIHLLLENR